MFQLCPPCQLDIGLLSFIYCASVTQASFQLFKLTCSLLLGDLCRCRDAHCVSSLPHASTHLINPYTSFRSEIKCPFFRKVFSVPSVQGLFIIIELSSFPEKHSANVQFYIHFCAYSITICVPYSEASSMPQRLCRIFLTIVFFVLSVSVRNMLKSFHFL